MKFNNGDVLYYACPFTFIISQVKIDFAYKEDDGEIYYIESCGAYLKEQDLFDDFKDAQMDALAKLNKFVYERRYHILHSNPQIGLGD